MKATGATRWRSARFVGVIAGVLAAALDGRSLPAQEGPITRIDLPVGRYYPVATSSPITRVATAVPTVADVVVVSEREVVISALAAGETDAILWLANGSRLHYRVSVRSPSDRLQIALNVKFAEVRRDALREIGVSGLYKEQGDVRVGTGTLNTGGLIGPEEGIIPTSARFLTVLTDFNTDRLLGFLEAQEQSGRARVLAEPSIMAGNKDSASFLAGGELPVPVVQGGGLQDAARVTIEYREFGVRLWFLAEIISDSLIKLRVRPEVSSLDFGNAILISGFRVPALRTRRIESTLDVRRNESLIISGLFNDEEERVKTGVPLLMHIPILGQLFSSTRFQRNESELVIIVTPVVVDPLAPRPQDVPRVRPDTSLPARDALRKRLVEPSAQRPPASRRDSPPPR